MLDVYHPSKTQFATLFLHLVLFQVVRVNVGSQTTDGNLHSACNDTQVIYLQPDLYPQL